MLFASRKLSASSILSPTAKPYIASASAWVDEQDRALSTLVPQSPESRQNNITRLDELNRQFEELNFDNESDDGPRTPTAPSPPSPCGLPLLGFQSPPRIGPIGPPTPAASARPPVSAHDRANEPVVRVTKATWDAMNTDLTTLLKQKRDLERQLARLEQDRQTQRDDEFDVDVKIGQLRYQNETNREQKAEMGRSLAQKDVELKQLKLDIENLQKKFPELEAEIARRGKLIGDAEWLRATKKEGEAAHARALEEKDAIVHRLQEEVDQLKRERDAATQANVHAGDHATRAQNLADTLSSRERLITDLHQKLLEEKMRGTELEEKVDVLQEKADQGNLDNLKEQLREKSSSLDRMRTKLKLAERHLENIQNKLSRVLNGGDALRGGAHPIIPNENSKLPKNVWSCVECFAQNIPCDNGARCRNCFESHTKCARFRCSMKHKLGDCPDSVCQLPHDPNGWLVTMDKRPEW